MTPSLPLPCEGGAEESCSTRYCTWYNGLCYCLACGEVIQWHFNRLSAFFAVALALICRIKTQPVRHWTRCLVVEQRECANSENGGARFPAYRQGCAYQWQTKVSSLETSGLWWEDGLLTHPTVSDGKELVYVGEETTDLHLSLSLRCRRYFVFRHKILCLSLVTEIISLNWLYTHKGQLNHHRVCLWKQMYGALCGSGGAF